MSTSFYTEGSLPAGLTGEATYRTVNGISFGSYDVQDSYRLTGSIATAGSYEVEVTFQVPVGSVLSGWVGKLWFGGVAARAHHEDHHHRRRIIHTFS